MGFSCEFYTYPKYNKEYTHKDFENVRKYFDYTLGTWNEENYSLENYLKDYEVNMPTQEEIDFYKSNFHIDEYGHRTLTDTLDWWCSNGVFIYNYLSTKYPPLRKEEFIEFQSREEVLELLTYFWKDYINSITPIECMCTHSFKVKYDEENDEEEITLKSCDGIELSYNDGNKIKRKYCGLYETEDLLLSVEENIVDEEYIYTRRQLISVLIKCLEIDFDNTGLIFCGGW